MAEILVKAIDATHVDQDKDRRGCYKKGDIVHIRPDNAGWGLKETLPKFVLVKCPGLSVETIKDRCSSWRSDIDYEILVTNANGWRIRVFKTEVSASGLNQLTASQVITYLTNWGAIVRSINFNEVIFDLPRTVDINEFKTDLKDKLNGVYCRRKYYFSNEDVDLAISNGGEITVTAAQLQSRVLSKLDDA